MFGDMNGGSFGGGGFGGGPWGPREPWEPTRPPGWRSADGGGYPSSGSGSPPPQSPTEKSQPETNATKQVSDGVALLLLGLLVLVPIGIVVWMLVEIFNL
jgi:hypothetical protein